jgi:hypothetical protein
VLYPWFTLIARGLVSIASSSVLLASLFIRLRTSFPRMSGADVMHLQYECSMSDTSCISIQCTSHHSAKCARFSTIVSLPFPTSRKSGSFQCPGPAYY